MSEMAVTGSDIREIQRKVYTRDDHWITIDPITDGRTGIATGDFRIRLCSNEESFSRVVSSERLVFEIGDLIGQVKAERAKRLEHDRKERLASATDSIAHHQAQIDAVKVKHPDLFPVEGGDSAMASKKKGKGGKGNKPPKY